MTTQPPKPRAVAYFRVSTDEQARSGLGLEAQKRDVLNAAKRLGLPIAAGHADEGLSGSLPATERPGLTGVLGDLRPGDVLLVAKRDRLARDHVEIGLLERQLAKRRVRVVSAAG